MYDISSMCLLHTKRFLECEAQLNNLLGNGPNKENHKEISLTQKY